MPRFALDLRKLRLLGPSPKRSASLRRYPVGWRVAEETACRAPLAVVRWLHEPVSVRAHAAADFVVALDEALFVARLAAEHFYPFRVNSINHAFLRSEPPNPLLNRTR